MQLCIGGIDFNMPITFNINITTWTTYRCLWKTVGAMQDAYTLEVKRFYDGGS